MFGLLPGIIVGKIKKELETPDIPRRTRRIRREKRFSLNRYGYVVADGREVPDEYLVKVTSIRNRCIVVAPLQEDIRLRVASRWDPFIPIEQLSRANIFTQAFTGVLGIERRALVTRATSRRIWQGSSPLELSLRLKFEAIQDPDQEVVAPGQLLQAMALPSDPSQEYRKTAEKGEFWKTVELLALKPPGPNPFSLDDVLTGRKSFPEMNENEIRHSTKGGDFIMIEIGRFLTFFNVIIKESGVNYKIKFTKAGDPVEAEADIVFETYEMMTIEGLYDCYDKYIATTSPEIWE